MLRDRWPGWGIRHCNRFLHVSRVVEVAEDWFRFRAGGLKVHLRSWRATAGSSVDGGRFQVWRWRSLLREGPAESGRYRLFLAMRTSGRTGCFIRRCRVFQPFHWGRLLLNILTWRSAMVWARSISIRSIGWSGSKCWLVTSDFWHLFTKMIKIRRIWWGGRCVGRVPRGRRRIFSVLIYPDLIHADSNLSSLMLKIKLLLQTSKTSCRSTILGPNFATRFNAFELKMWDSNSTLSLNSV